ncbi:MAG: hypothetical protein R3C44_00585 [Chloroflexota bacterium]
MQASKRQSHLFTLVILAALAVLLAACSSGTPATTETAVPTVADVVEAAAEAATATPPPAEVGESYPAPQAEPVLSAYPAEGEAGVPEPTPLPDGYPAATAEDEAFLEPRFRIDTTNLTVGAEVVEGQAPPNLALAILDVTYNGTLLGTGQSDENGHFSIAVSPALVEGNRIGVTVAELEAGQSLNQMAEAYYPHRGEGFMNLPNVGILFDTALVQP